MLGEYRPGDRLRAEDVNALIRLAKSRRGSGSGDDDYHAEPVQRRQAPSPYGDYDVPLAYRGTTRIPPFSVVAVYRDSVTELDQPPGSFENGFSPGNTQRLYSTWRGYEVHAFSVVSYNDPPWPRPHLIIVDENGIPASNGSTYKYGWGSIAATPCLAAIAMSGTDTGSVTNTTIVDYWESSPFNPPTGVLTDSPQALWGEILAGPQSGSFVLHTSQRAGAQDYGGPFFPVGPAFRMPDGLGGHLWTMMVMQDLCPRAYGQVRSDGDILSGDFFSWSPIARDATEGTAYSRQRNTRDITLSGSTSYSGIQVFTAGRYKYSIYGTLFGVTGYGGAASGVITLNPVVWDWNQASLAIGLRSPQPYMPSSVTWALARKWNSTSGYSYSASDTVFCGNSFYLSGILDLGYGSIVGLKEYAKVPSVTADWGNCGMTIELIDRYRNAFE